MLDSVFHPLHAMPVASRAFYAQQTYFWDVLPSVLLQLLLECVNLGHHFLGVFPGEVLLLQLDHDEERRCDQIHSRRWLQICVETTARTHERNSPRQVHSNNETIQCRVQTRTSACDPEFSTTSFQCKQELTCTYAVKTARFYTGVAIQKHDNYSDGNAAQTKGGRRSRGKRNREYTIPSL